MRYYYVFILSEEEKQEMRKYNSSTAVLRDKAKLQIFTRCNSCCQHCGVKLIKGDPYLNKGSGALYAYQRFDPNPLRKFDVTNIYLLCMSCIKQQKSGKIKIDTQGIYKRINAKGG